MFYLFQFIKKCNTYLFRLSNQCSLSLSNKLSKISFSKKINPLSSKFGFDRGKPIDRYYIEKFLELYCNDIKGHVLEIGDDSYTKFFGGDKVTKRDVLCVTPGNSRATIISDLSKAENIESDSFDCIIFTQTLQFIYDFDSAAKNLHRILKKGGILLATFPGISQISRYDMSRWGDYWRFTDLSIKRIFEKYFSSENVKVDTFGNVLVAISFLHGLSLQEIKKRDLDYKDENYQVLITLWAIKN
jgi:SAM-dependent methyltransferase